MTIKNKIIKEIENLSPMDSNTLDTRAMGKYLITETIEEFGWRNLPSNFLKIYLKKCKELQKIKERNIKNNQ